MPLVVKASVVLARVSGVTEDSVINTFYFQRDTNDPLDAGDADELAARLVGFYNDIATGAAFDIASRISEVIDRSASACRVDLYSIVEGSFPVIWGSPDFMRNFTLDAAAGGTPLPSEIAIALSYHADLTNVPETAPNPVPPPATIRPAARLRGRLFIGPFQSQVVAEDTVTHEPYVETGMRLALRGSASDLVAANTAEWEWAQFSQTEGLAEPVVGGFVDIAFDSQRRRGDTAQLRETWA